MAFQMSTFIINLLQKLAGNSTQSMMPTQSISKVKCFLSKLAQVTKVVTTSMHLCKKPFLQMYLIKLVAISSHRELLSSASAGAISWFIVMAKFHSHSWCQWPNLVCHEATKLTKMQSDEPWWSKNLGVMRSLNVSITWILWDEIARLSKVDL